MNMLRFKCIQILIKKLQYYCICQRERGGGQGQGGYNTTVYDEGGGGEDRDREALVAGGAGPSSPFVVGGVGPLWLLVAGGAGCSLPFIGGVGPSSLFMPGGTGCLLPFVCGGLGPLFTMHGAGGSCNKDIGFYPSSILFTFHYLAFVSHDSFPYLSVGSHVTIHLLSFKPPLHILCVRNSIIPHSPLEV